jgi:8-oxo-dGTP diphosphatase
MSPDSRPTRNRAEAALSPKDYNAGDYPNFAVTCDIVIFTMEDQTPSILLVQRGADPFAGMWALPGGFKHPDETLDETARRELLEETNVEAPPYLQQFHTYGDPGRDPRTNVVTVAYVAVVPELSGIIGGTDAAAAALHPVENVLEGALPLAFDHQQIVNDAYVYVSEQLEVSDIATKFVPKAFSLSQLRNVYESFWGAELDAANFRRNLLMETANYVSPTGRTSSSTPSGGRPPELFKATKAWRDSGPPIRRRRRDRS